MKRLFLLFPIALAGLTASASFDRAAWLGKRERLTQEALRLRAAYTNCAARIDCPAEDVSVSLETFPDGSVKTSITAKRAQFFLESDLVWVEGVVLRKFKKDGSLDAHLEAENGVVDRTAKAGWADGAAKVTQGKTTFAGRSVFFSSPESYVKVFRETDMESYDLKTGGLRP